MSDSYDIQAELERLRAAVAWHENAHHGCTCGWTKDDQTIKPDCLYHRWAAEHPLDHRSPWNCPTYYDGCNCKDTRDALRAANTANAELLAALKDAVEDVADFSQYVGDYLNKKCGTASNLREYRSLIARHEGSGDE